MKKIITTNGTEFEQNGKDLSLIETTDRAGKPTMLSSTDLKAGFNNAGNTVVSTIDSNLVPSNIKKDVTILGVTGTHQGGQVLHQWDGISAYSKIYINPEPDISSQEIQNAIANITDNQTLKTFISGYMASNAGGTVIQVEGTKDDGYISLYFYASLYDEAEDANRSVMLCNWGVDIPNDGGPATIAWGGEAIFSGANSFISDDGNGFQAITDDGIDNNYFKLATCWILVDEADKIEETVL